MSSLKIRSFVFHLFLSAVLMVFLSDALKQPYQYMWFVAVNAVTFVSFGRDKAAAKYKKFGAMFGRTPEMTFHLLGCCGAFPSIFAGRAIFHHKTSKMGFIVPMFTLFVIQLVAVAWFFGDLGRVYAASGDTPPPQASHHTAAQPAD